MYMSYIFKNSMGMKQTMEERIRRPEKAAAPAPPPPKKRNNKKNGTSK